MSQLTMHQPEELYMKIRIGSLGAMEPIPFDVFVLVNTKYVHYLRAGDSITFEKIQAFETKASDVFYIQMSQKENYRNYLTRQLRSDTIDAKAKAYILRESSLSMIEELFETSDVARAIKESKQIVAGFIDFIDANPEGMAHLIGLSSHDFYTYNHSLDVGIYGLGLGKLAGYSAQDLQELGEGSLFHDIGKRHVDVQIICKNGPLNDVEWAQMQKHPQYGLLILEDHKISEAIKACCFEHHESFLGNGYPQQLSAEEIHPMARIVAICDTYDAMTTKRSYNEPMSPKDAITFMTTKLANRYDPDLLKAMAEVTTKA